MLPLTTNCSGRRKLLNAGIQVPFLNREGPLRESHLGPDNLPRASDVMVDEPRWINPQRIDTASGVLTKVPIFLPSSAPDNRRHPRNLVAGGQNGDGQERRQEGNVSRPAVAAKRGCETLKHFQEPVACATIGPESLSLRRILSIRIHPYLTIKNKSSNKESQPQTSTILF